MARLVAHHVQLRADRIERAGMRGTLGLDPTKLKQNQIQVLIPLVSSIQELNCLQVIGIIQASQKHMVCAEMRSRNSDASQTTEQRRADTSPRLTAQG